MRERAARFEEGLALMKRLWAEDEVTHHGRFYRVTGARPTARPCQRPWPRIWIAAMAAPPVRRAARLGHPFFGLGTLGVEAMAGLLDLWRRDLAARGHPVPAEIPIHRELYVAPTREEARRLALPGVEAKYRGYASHGLPGAAEMLAAGADRLLGDPFVVGSPEDCVEALARYRQLGVTHVAARLHWPGMAHAQVLRMIELVGARVIPALR
jgi:alkanesulfonate monooxygenase SsuD/methylene tetrahydromethanopterin reductase-like flavin-dependent oxidoreductase (luciferase family)